MNKLNVRMVFVTVMAALLCSCGRGDSGQEVRFWHFWDNAVIEPIVEEFERRNPGVKVAVEQLTWQSGLEKIQAAIASGTQPDLCELGSTWLPRFSYEGVLEDLSVVHSEIADSFMAWDSAMWQGKVYGLPWVQGTRVLFFNVDLFTDAALDPQRPPVTWDGLLEAAERIDGLGDDISGFGLNLGERYVLYKKFMAFAWGNEGKILNGDGAVAYNSLENLEAMEFYRKLAEFSLKEKQESLIRERVPRAKTLLDVACGTGRHLEYLARNSGFDCTGVDLDEEMLAIARDRVPGVTLQTGDMRDFDLNARFDVVACLFSSIGYTRTVEHMNHAVANMASHVVPGGILVVEPWITPESWIVGKAHSSTAETNEFIVTRMMVAEPVERGRVVFEYLIGDSSGISRISETHEMGWFTHMEYMSAVQKAGLIAEHVQPGLTDRGLYVGRKS